MVSYADFHRKPSQRREAMRAGVRAHLGIPKRVAVYLDNGAFFFSAQEGRASLTEYEEFVEAARPDWCPIPRDYIPAPSMSPEEQRACFDRTMRVNHQYGHNGYVPVVHIGPYLTQYTERITADDRLAEKKGVALGGIVPNLLRKARAMPYGEINAGPFCGKIGRSNLARRSGRKR